MLKSCVQVLHGSLCRAGGQQAPKVLLLAAALMPFKPGALSNLQYTICLMDPKLL
jgi:hypothetical protein